MFDIHVKLRSLNRILYTMRNSLPRPRSPYRLRSAAQETLLELLRVHEADRDSGMVEDAHHLARHVVRDDWALCTAAAQ
jgi:hypothetical protein